MELRSVVRGLPCCVLKHMKAQDVLNDTETLMTISKKMRKAQLKALLQGVSNRGGASPPHRSTLAQFVVPKHLERLQDLRITMV